MQVRRLKGCLRPVPTQLFHDRIAVVRLDDRGPRAQRTGALRSDLFILLEGELDLLVGPRSASQRDLVEGAREGVGTAAWSGRHLVILGAWWETRRTPSSDCDLRTRR